MNFSHNFQIEFLFKISHEYFTIDGKKGTNSLRKILKILLPQRLVFYYKVEFWMNRLSIFLFEMFELKEKKAISKETVKS
jgi:hypothetical protein